MTELLRTTTLEGVVLACKLRRSHLGLPQLEVDEKSGLQNGYTGKLEVGIKGLGKITMPLLLGALGLELAVVPASTHSSTHRGETGLSEDFFSRRARKAVAARWAKTPPKKRKAMARAAARARWRRAT